MSTYDHKIKIDDKEMGFHLAKDENNASLYSVMEDATPMPLAFAQNNWIGGHGQYDFSLEDMYFEGQSIDTTQDGRIINGPLINQVGISGADLGANPVCFCWFNAISKWMVATATKIFWYDGTNFVEQEEFAGETITDMADVGDIMYVSLDSATRYYYTTNGADYTQTDLTDGYAEKIFGAPNPAATATVIWKNKLPNEVSQTTNGTVDSPDGVQWSTPPNYIGDTSNDITNIFLVNDNLMIGKEDRLWHLDSNGGTHPLLNDLAHNRSSTNFKYVTEYQTSVYFSLITGLGKISSYNTYNTVGALKETGDIGKVGTPVGLASDSEYLYEAEDEGTNTHIYKSRLTRSGGTLRWEHCPWVFLGTNACATMKVCQHSSTDRRLWFGYGDYAAYVILTDNPTADSAARFAPSGFIRMSYIYGTNKYWDKMFQSIVTETKGCASGKTVTAKYRKDTDTTATVCTPAIKTNGVVYTNMSNELDCKRIQFELHLVTDASASTPEALYFEARGQEKPELKRIHEAVYIIGSTPSRRTKTIRDFLRKARTTTKLIKFADERYKESIDKDFHWVIMQPGYPQEPETLHTKGKQPELGMRCRFEEVSFTS